MRTISVLQAPQRGDTVAGKEALGAHKKALKIRLKRLGPKHPIVASPYNDMAGVYGSQGREEEAQEASRHPLEIKLKLLPLDLKMPP